MALDFSQLASPVVRAFLNVISYCEGANYNTLYGGGTFGSYATHPNINYSGSACMAAGRYQFCAATWRGLVRQYGFSDFSPANQDAGALALIYGRGAYQDVISGNILSAIPKLRQEWPSLPGGSQQTRTMQQVLAYWQQQTGQVTQTTQTTSTADADYQQRLQLAAQRDAERNALRNQLGLPIPVNYGAEAAARGGLVAGGSSQNGLLLLGFLFLVVLSRR